LPSVPETKKNKKPKTEKQLEAFKKCVEAKRVQSEMKKMLKSQADKEKREEKERITLAAKEALLKMKHPSPSSSDEEPEIPDKKKNKKKRKIVTYEESESDDEELSHPMHRPIPHRAPIPVRPPLESFIYL